MTSQKIKHHKKKLSSSFIWTGIHCFVSSVYWLRLCKTKWVTDVFGTNKMFAQIQKYGWSKPKSSKALFGDQNLYDFPFLYSIPTWLCKSVSKIFSLLHLTVVFPCQSANLSWMSQKLTFPIYSMSELANPARLWDSSGTN